MSVLEGPLTSDLRRWFCSHLLAGFDTAMVISGAIMTSGAASCAGAERSCTGAERSGTGAERSGTGAERSCTGAETSISLEAL